MAVRVLLVEDHASVRYVYRRWLERAGYLVLEADSVKHVRDRDRTVPHNQPEVIICDHDLPDGHHEDVAALWPEVPLIVVSGWARPQGYTGIWLRKPFTSDELLAALDAL